VSELTIDYGERDLNSTQLNVAVAERERERERERVEMETEIVEFMN
jgi:hypothetical protein